MARRWIFYLAVNVLVSATTMLGVLALWDRSQRPAAMVAPTLAGTAAAEFPTSNTTPSVYPTATPRVYIVKSGDIFGKIAEANGISVESLLEINPQIADPDSLQPGDSLFLPTKEPTAVPGADHPTITPGANTTGAWPVLTGVLSPGKLSGEALRITNSGPTINLQGWKISAPRKNSAKPEEYIFGDISLVTGGMLMIHTAAGKDSSADLYWGLAEPLWTAGDEALLLDGTGSVRSVFVIPAE